MENQADFIKVYSLIINLVKGIGVAVDGDRQKIDALCGALAVLLECQHRLSSTSDNLATQHPNSSKRTKNPCAECKKSRQKVRLQSERIFVVLNLHSH